MLVKKEFKTQQEREEYIQEKAAFKKYLENRRSFVLTSRFGTYSKNGIQFDTWAENTLFRKNHTKVGCIYGTPDKISPKIPVDSVLFILEMNNDINKIMGIGMIKNHPVCGRYRTYEEGNFNRYIYVGRHRIDRTEMTETEENIMKAFDILCFTGNHHMKRGKGITSYPPYMLFKCNRVIDLAQFISDMFKKRFSSSGGGITQNKKSVL